MKNIKSNKLFCCAIAVLMGVCSNLYGSDHAPDPFALGAPAHRLAPGYTITDKEVIDFATARIAEIEAQIPLWQQMLDEEKYDELIKKIRKMFTHTGNAGSIYLSEVKLKEFMDILSGEQRNAIALLNVLDQMNSNLTVIIWYLSEYDCYYTVEGNMHSDGQKKGMDIQKAKNILKDLQNRHYIAINMGSFIDVPSKEIRSPYAEVAFPLVDAYVEKRLASDGAHGTTAATPVTHNEDDE